MRLHFDFPKKSKLLGKFMLNVGVNQTVAVGDNEWLVEEIVEEFPKDCKKAFDMGARFAQP